ncbi:quinone oxidoreductase family protein [Halobellus rubicundus]|uniref:Zinc-binding alcohol dehydrogenase family protein n=1 Tax=Halobellus rubicundus TaxID=2996466 RepID=A0ABD5MFR8_9EURY
MCYLWDQNMRAIRYHKPGGSGKLQIDEINQPEPGPNEVLVKTRAVSVNPVDLVIRNSSHTNHPKTIGSDIAGEVESIGDDVTTFQVGDRVFATGLHAGHFSRGSFADYVLIPIDLLSSLPKDVSFEHGAAIALVGVTAWRAFIHHTNINPGDTVLIHGGNGGVGHIAIQIASLIGATVIATSRRKHHSILSDLGADYVFDYTSNDLGQEIKSNCNGVDVILDSHPQQYICLNTELLNLNGDIVIINGAETIIPDITSMRQKEIDLHMMSMTNLVIHQNLPDIGSVLKEIGQLMSNSQLTVRIHREYSLESADEAYSFLQENSVLGKVVVKP